MSLSTLNSNWGIIDQNVVEITSEGVYETSLTAAGTTSYIAVTLYSDTVINLSECGLVIK